MKQDKKELLNNIRELTEIESPSGREGAVAKVIRKNLATIRRSLRRGPR